MASHKKNPNGPQPALSPDVRARITANFKDDSVRFSRTDFLDLAKKHGKDISTVSRILKKLAAADKIVAVDEIQTIGGGWKHYVYIVVSGAEFGMREVGYRDRVANKEKHDTECALRLQAALGLTVIFKSCLSQLKENDMPSAPGYKRDYKTERATSLERGDGVKNAERKQARRDMEKKGLVKPFDGKDVDHKVPLSKGGSAGESNLRVKGAAANRSYPRKKDGSIK